MSRKMVMDEDKVFDACALVEEIVKTIALTNAQDTSGLSLLVKASQAALLLNQALEEGELV